jgi:hypothetical protein
MNWSCESAFIVIDVPNRFLDGSLCLDAHSMTITMMNRGFDQYINIQHEFNVTHESAALPWRASFWRIRRYPPISVRSFQSPNSGDRSISPAVPRLSGLASGTMITTTSAGSGRTSSGTAIWRLRSVGITTLQAIVFIECSSTALAREPIMSCPAWAVNGGGIASCPTL